MRYVRTFNDPVALIVPTISVCTHFFSLTFYYYLSVESDDDAVAVDVIQYLTISKSERYVFNLLIPFIISNFM